MQAIDISGAQRKEGRPRKIFTRKHANFTNLHNIFLKSSYIIIQQIEGGSSFAFVGFEIV
jgi:hypothetical protein